MSTRPRASVSMRCGTRGSSGCARSSRCASATRSHCLVRPGSCPQLCLNGAMETVEEVAPNRVRLTVDVPQRDVHHAVEHAANDLAASVKIPGFRKGKVPMPVLVQRVGKERLYQEAVESHISGWFWNAAARARVRPVATPEYQFDLPTSDREDWSFAATVDV